MTALGNSGIDVTPLCLGGNVFGWTIDAAASFAVLDAYHELGGRFIDTADIYSTWVEGNRGGESERIIGSWLRDRGIDDVVVATKVGLEMPEGSGLSRDYVLAASERCRERLGVDVIDVLYAHRPDTATPITETMRAFDELAQDGSVRAIGLSNYDAGQLREALDACDEHGLARPVVLQPEYNLLTRGAYEGELQATCVEEGLAAAPYYALASGFLTGKYQPDAPAPDSRRAGGVLRQFGTPEGWAALAAVEQVAARHDATPSQVALAWLRSRGGVVAPIASGTSPAQVTELMGSVDLELTPDDLALLD
ncbi:MAG: Oxidoreductase, aldo/keto reductase family [Thermoleophilia bacterium]|nr:Oxidoreductase, aldo/keto reductase family [Thermoleophilia bacterium]